MLTPLKQRPITAVRRRGQLIVPKRNPDDGVFHPADLFQGGEEGAAFDWTDAATLFRDDAGTLPAEAGDGVAVFADISGNGTNGSQTWGTARPVRRLGFVETFDTRQGFSLPMFAGNAAPGMTIALAGIWATATGGTAWVSGNQGHAHRRVEFMTVPGIRGGDPYRYEFGPASTVGSFEVLTLLFAGSRRFSDARIFRGMDELTGGALTDVTVDFSGPTAQWFNGGAAGAQLGQFYAGLMINRELTSEERARWVHWAASRRVGPSGAPGAVVAADQVLETEIAVASAKIAGKRVEYFGSDGADRLVLRFQDQSAGTRERLAVYVPEWRRQFVMTPAAAGYECYDEDVRAFLSDHRGESVRLEW